MGDNDFCVGGVGILHLHWVGASILY